MLSLRLLLFITRRIWPLTFILVMGEALYDVSCVLMWQFTRWNLDYTDLLWTSTILKAVDPDMEIWPFPSASSSTFLVAKE